jgi:hypothetical protein
MSSTLRNTSLKTRLLLIAELKRDWCVLDMLLIVANLLDELGRGSIV